MKSILGRGAERKFERKFASSSLAAMQSLHLTADLHALRQLCLDAVAASGLRALSGGRAIPPVPRTRWRAAQAQTHRQVRGASP